MADLKNPKRDINIDKTRKRGGKEVLLDEVGATVKVGATGDIVLGVTDVVGLSIDEAESQRRAIWNSSCCLDNLYPWSFQ